MHTNHKPARTMAALASSFDIIDNTGCPRSLMRLERRCYSCHAHAVFSLVPFITWHTCFHRRAAHDVEPKNHQQEQKKLPRVSAVVARWTIPHWLVSIRKKNRARVHRRNLHVLSTKCRHVVLCTPKGAATHAIFKFLILNRSTQSSCSTSREPTVGRRHHKTKGTKPPAQAGTNLK